MYDELVTRIRLAKAVLSRNKDLIALLSDSADAIEELSKPRFIPVTERLPEEAGKYLVCGRWRGKQTEIWVCEFMALGHLKGWANNAANPVVSHWMPLPDPPKEEP